MLLSLIKKSFKQVFENSSIMIFLVAYLIIIGVITPFIRNDILAMVLGICIILLTIVHFAGWFQLVNAIAIEKNNELENKTVFSVFLEGIGRNIVPLIIAFIFYFAILMLFLYVSGFVANHFFGDIQIVFQDIMTSMQGNNNLILALEALPDDKKMTFYGWQFYFIVVTCILSFIFITYCPFLINSEKNIFVRPFIAFWESLKFTFKNFLMTVAIYASIYAAYILINVLRGLAGSNTIISMVLFLIYIYFSAIVVMLIFNYYDAKNNCSDRSDSIGENETVDTAGKED